MSEVRISGGIWRRTPLSVIDRPGLRPTPDRVRQTLFNWIGQSLDGIRVIDAFAGSGALGLEAASRGASVVEMIERDPGAAAAIRAVLARLAASSDPASRAAAARVHLHRDDVLRILARLAARRACFELALLDPPFGRDWIERVLPALRPVLAGQARIYVESDNPVAAQTLAQWSASLGPGAELTLLRQGRAGQVHYHVLAYRNLDLDP